MHFGIDFRSRVMFISSEFRMAIFDDVTGNVRHAQKASFRISERKTVFLMNAIVVDCWEHRVKAAKLTITNYT